jgi:hypothetical protein
MPASAQIALADHIDPVRQRRKHRNREHVSERVGSGHQPGLRGGEAPQRDQVLDHDRRHDDMREQVADLARAHRGDKRAAGQVHSQPVMPGLVPGIHVFFDSLFIDWPEQAVDGRASRRLRPSSTACARP